MESIEMLFQCPTKIMQGRGLAGITGEILKKNLGIRNVLLVSDPSVKEAGHLEEILSSLDKEKIQFSLFDQVIPEPPTWSVENHVKLVKDKALDAIIAVGGGSTIDTAKGLRLLANLGGTLKDYAGVGKVVSPLSPPLISVPTTAGTGSETSNAAAFKDEDKRAKFAVISWPITPNLCIADPLLTLTKPQFLTAITGIDTLAHLVESYVSRKANPISDMINLEGIRLIGKYLERAYCNGDDLEAREKVQMASFMAGVAFNHTQVGLDHSIAMPLSSKANVPHGVSIGVMLPYVMEFNRPAAPTKFREIACAFGMNVNLISQREAGERAVEFVKGIVSTLGIPGRLRDIGITEEMMPSFFEGTMASMHTQTNPRLVTKENLEHLFRHAY